MKKILTNIRFYHVAGVAQYLGNLINYNEKVESFKIFGVDIINKNEIQDYKPHRNYKNFNLIDRTIDYPMLGEVNDISNGNIDVFFKKYVGVINTYLKEIKKVRPDIIIVNGTYFLPWCLLQAAKQYGKAKIVVHYHGLLSKETAHWPNKMHFANMVAMEKCFDDDNIFYIFPSKIAKDAVEDEVFKHKIKNYTVLPNPVPDIFFKKYNHKTTQDIRKNNIGIVSRWTKIKNIDFIIDFAKHNNKKNKFNINIITDNCFASGAGKEFKDIINFKKPIQNSNLHKFYQSQGIILSPSIFETYGNVAQEAIACGTPVLVNKNMGISETLKRIGLSKYIVDFDSPQKVIAKIQKEIGLFIPKESIKILQTEYCNENIFKKYFSLLNSIV